MASVIITGSHLTLDECISLLILEKAGGIEITNISRYRQDGSDIQLPDSNATSAAEQVRTQYNATGKEWDFFIRLIEKAESEKNVSGRYAIGEWLTIMLDSHMSVPMQAWSMVRPVLEQILADEQAWFVAYPALLESTELARSEISVGSESYSIVAIKTATADLDITRYMVSQRKVEADIAIAMHELEIACKGPKAVLPVLKNQLEQSPLTAPASIRMSNDGSFLIAQLATPTPVAELLAVFSAIEDPNKELAEQAAAQKVEFTRKVEEIQNVPIELDSVQLINKQSAAPEPQEQPTTPTSTAPVETQQTEQTSSTPAAPAAHASPLPPATQLFEVPHYDEAALRLAVLPHENPHSPEAAEAAAQLFTHPDAQAGVVLQSGNGTHVLRANPDIKVELRDVVRVIRVEEARKREINLDGESSRALSKPGELDEMPGWNFEHQDNVLMWEGPDDSQISPEEMMQAVYAGLSNELLEANCPPVGCRGPECYFFMYQLPRCKDRKKESNWKADGTIREPQES